MEEKLQDILDVIAVTKNDKNLLSLHKKWSQMIGKDSWKNKILKAIEKRFTQI